MAGHPEALFWSLTPRQIDVHLQAYRERRRRAYNDAVQVAWHQARLAAYPPTNPTNFTKLESLTVSRTERQRQTVEQRLAAASAWAAAMNRS